MPEVLEERSRSTAKEEQEEWWRGEETDQGEASALGRGALPPKPPWREVWLQWVAARRPRPQHTVGLGGSGAMERRGEDLDEECLPEPG